MNKIIRSSVWALSLLLVSSSFVLATLDSQGGMRGLLKKGAENPLLKQKYIEKYEQWKKEGKIKNSSKDKKAVATPAKQAAKKPVASTVQQPAEPSCPSRFKTKNKCVSADRVLTHQLCATKANVDNLDVALNARIQGDLSVNGNAAFAQNVAVAGNESIAGNLAVGGNATVDGDLKVNGAISGAIATLDRINANRADFDVETTNVSYEDVNVIEDLRVWQTERFVTPDYDRFPDGALPQTTKIGPGETYEFTSLSPLTVPIAGNDWNSIVHGIIDFTTATDKEKLDFYSGAQNRIFQLMNDGPFSATEQEIKVGATAGGLITQLSTNMPADQQKFAAQAMREIKKGLETVNPELLSGADKVILFNLITQAQFYSTAWDSGTTQTNVLGVEYFGSPNPAELSAYLYQSALFPPFLNAALIPVQGISNDGAALVPYARALPGLYKLFPRILDNWISTAIDGLSQGYYPHVLRSRPFTSAGESTFGTPGFGYSPNVVNLVQTGNFPAIDDSRLFAVGDYIDLFNASFEDQLDPNLLFRSTFTIEGLNPLPLLDMLVEQGVMDQTEADYIQEEARKAYDTVVKPALLNWLAALWLDPVSPLVRALRLTKYDDFPGEWGYKYQLDTTGKVPGVKGLINPATPNEKVVFVDVLGDDVVIRDEQGAVVNIPLQTVTLVRDEAAGEEHYISMAEIVLKLTRDTPIPFYAKVRTTPNVNPFENWEVQFDTSSSTLPQKLHAAGETLINFFSEQIDFYLNQWVTQTNPCGITPPPTTWQECYGTREEAIAAISKSGRLIADLEDPVNEGVWAFVQHYKPREDEQGPLYDFSQIEAYYTASWDETPHLIPFTATTPKVYDRDGNVLYDPQAVGPDGLRSIEALNAASILDTDKADYYRFLSSIDINNGKSARVYYFFYDFVKHSFEEYMTIGKNPLMPYYFSPYIVDAFNKIAAHQYLNVTYASGANYDPVAEIITYTHLLDYLDPRSESIGTRTTILHEFIMGHSIQIPLTEMINSTGTTSWLTNAVSNAATAEGWAVFIETFFGPLFTSYLSAVDPYFNYTDPTGVADPVTMVPSIANTSRVAARLKWDTGVHSRLYKNSLAEYSTGIEVDTFGGFTITTEVGQRIPTSPTQGLNYGLGFLQIVGLFQNLPAVLGQERYDELQSAGNLATKYFFDFMLIDTQGYFISSLEPLYNDWAARVKAGVPPFNAPGTPQTYQGYPVDAFDAHTVAYVPGTNPAAYEFTDNPYVSGGFTFNFPACPVQNSGVCPSPTAAVVAAKKAAAITAVPAVKAATAVKAVPAVKAPVSVKAASAPATVAQVAPSKAQPAKQAQAQPATVIKAPAAQKQYQKQAPANADLAKKVAFVKKMQSQKN